MASGDTLRVFNALSNEPPASAYATFDTRNSHPLLDFDAGTDEIAIFGDVLPQNYAGGGITVAIHFAATGITTGSVVWGADFEKIGSESQDIDSDGFTGSPKTTTATVPGTDGQVKVVAITFTNGEIDSLAAGDGYRIKIYRDADNAADTAAADAELRFIHLKET